jgi:hypothetical protein
MQPLSALFAIVPVVSRPPKWQRASLCRARLTKEEVEEVFQDATDEDISRSSGRPVVFGDTSTGRHLMVVYEEIDVDTVYPVSTYDVPRRQRP